MDLVVAGLVSGSVPPRAASRKQLTPVLSWRVMAARAFLPSCRCLSWSSEARVPRVPAPAPLGTTKDGWCGRSTRLLTVGTLGVVLGSVSAFSASLCTISLGPVVLVCLVFCQADRCMGSEVCTVLNLWIFLGKRPEERVGD